MAKRELSSTLKNLKFMQRAIQKEEQTKKEEDVKLEEHSVRSTAQSRKCIVIMEGDPHPGALKGRMSFQSFNPSVDKINEEAECARQPQVSTENPPNNSGLNSNRDMGESQSKNEDSSAAKVGINHDPQRKKHKIEVSAENSHQSSKKNRVVKDNGDSSMNNRKDPNQQKNGRLDWRVLRPPTG
ncbi:hypothetical protein AMTRI_Chr08g162160 [Amborella trichopoda]